MIKLTDILNEDCWKGYKQIGGKMKNGKMVPNCVPESVVKEELSSQDRTLIYKLTTMALLLTVILFNSLGSCTE